MNPAGFSHVTALALATAAISTTISRAHVFASPREWIASRSTWLGELVSCSYCTSHWVAMTLVAIYRPVLITQWIIADLLVSMFAVVAIAAIVSGVITKLNPFPSRNDELRSEVAQLKGALQLARTKLVEQARTNIEL